MKKITKVIISLVIIAGIALGAYFILRPGQDNSKITSNVKSLNSNEIFVKVNNTINVMIDDIQANSYDLPEIQTYFDIYVDTMANYAPIKDEIIKNGLYMNKNESGDYYKNMNSSYEVLLDIYNSSNEYLAKTYDQTKSKVYIENFYNLFKDALKQLNAFYYNAGISYIKATDNSLTTNNLYKLEFESYLMLCNDVVRAYLADGTILSTAVSYIETQRQDFENVALNIYIENKSSIDKLMEMSISSKNTLNQKLISGEIQIYINGLTKETEKQDSLNYFNLVLAD